MTTKVRVKGTIPDSGVHLSVYLTCKEMDLACRENQKDLLEENVEPVQPMDETDEDLIGRTGPCFEKRWLRHQTRR